jgi:hypothetical protein
MRLNSQNSEQEKRLLFKKLEALAEEKRKKFERDREQERENAARKA